MANPVPILFINDFVKGSWLAGLQNPTHARIDAVRPSSASHIRRIGSIRGGCQSRILYENFAQR